MILSKDFQETIHAAIYLAVHELNHQYLTSEHILFCSLDNKKIIKILENLNIDIIGIRNSLYQFLQYDLYDLTNKNLEKTNIVRLKFTDHLINFFERLIIRKKSNEKNNTSREIEIEDFIIEVMLDYESYSYYFLKKFNIVLDELLIIIENNKEPKESPVEKEENLGHFGENSIFNNSKKYNKINDLYLSEQRAYNQKKQDDNYNYFSNFSSQNNFNSGNLFGPHNNNSFMNNIDNYKNPKSSILETYCLNFNLSAKNGKIDPIFDREEEVKSLLKALYCRRKGNALLIGDSGVGKTAIVEYLAQKIANGDTDVPKRLRNTIIYSLDLNSLISGTRYRGDLEERMKLLMNDIKSSKQKIILLIDEIHSVIGTGSTNNGTLDIGNILKPYLARSMIYCIGATTRKEFTQYLIKDKAFIRRFQVLFINEPSIDSAYKMISGIIYKYEEYHNVKYTKDAIKASILLSKRYMPEKHLPDVALDVIDYTGSSKSILFEQKGNIIDKKENNEIIITKKEIEDTISEIVKLPKDHISSSSFAKYIIGLKSFLNEKIIGQNEAVDIIYNSIVTNKSQFFNQDEKTKPTASYIFYGPTGVGKTEMSIQLASYLDMKFIRIDMSEFSESHSVSKLFGAPPGYVGFEQSGILTEQVIKNPYSVILFDEIEKAHPNLMNSLLQILDYGNLTDNFGQKVNFSNCIIICTTNSGSRSMSKIIPGFDSNGKNEMSFRELESFFSPEFRNRFSSIIHFKQLNKESILKIINSKLSEISDKLKHKNIELCIDSKINNFIAENRYKSDMGARIIDRIIEDEITSKISNLFFEHKISKKHKQIKKVFLSLLENYKENEKNSILVELS